MTLRELKNKNVELCGEKGVIIWATYSTARAGTVIYDGNELNDFWIDWGAIPESVLDFEITSIFETNSSLGISVKNPKIINMLGEAL